MNEVRDYAHLVETITEELGAGARERIKSHYDEWERDARERGADDLARFYADMRETFMRILDSASAPTSP